MVPMRTQSSKDHLEKMVQYLASEYELTNMIEIGSYAGDSTAIFAKYFQQVECIDPWESNIGGITNSVDMAVVARLFAENTRGMKNIIPIKNYSYRIASRFEGYSYSFVYVDGAHDYHSVVMDIKLYKNKVEPGCFFGGHDYTPKFPDVMRAVKEEFPRRNIITFRDTSWIVRV